MANDADSTTGPEKANGLTPVALTTVPIGGAITEDAPPLDKIAVFLRRVMPAVPGPDDATHPMQALIPWVCDVLQSKAKKLVAWETAQDIAAVQSPKVQKNTTPALTEQQAVLLLHAPDTSTLAGLRDRALLHTFFITACRVSALTRARIGHLEFDGSEWYLNVTEKRGKKQRKILLEAARSILAYMDGAGITDDVEGPLFRRFAADGKTLLRASLSRETVWRIVKKHCVAAGIPPDRLGARGIGVHSLAEDGAQ